MNLDELMQIEELQLKRLQEIVELSIQEELLLSAKLLEAEKDQIQTLGEKLSDKIAEFGGSWAFIASFLFAMFLWIFANVLFLKEKSFDPYPFILLNLILSCVAALQAPIIMMSQNRKEDKDRRRATNDYMINLKAEIEVRNLHGKMDLLITDQMKSLFDVQRAQLELLNKLDAKIPNIKI